jgi:anti-sigma-K factor RskA
MRENDDDKLARALDRQDVNLTPEQRRLAEQVAADERALSGLLDAPLPPGVLHRVAARVAAERAKAPADRQRQAARLVRRRRWTAGIIAATAAAAAAVFLLALTLNHPTPTGPQVVHNQNPRTAPAGNLDAEVAMIEAELNAYRQAFITDDSPQIPNDVDQAIEALAREE